MRVWLDDVRPMPNGYDIHARTAREAIRLLQSGSVAAISFDHDLGTGPDGCDVATVIEAGAACGQIGPIEWAIHSANPVGRQRIEAAMQSAERFWLNSSTSA